MLHRLAVAVCAFSLALWTPAFAAAPPTFAISLVPAAAGHGAGHDAGVAVTAGAFVRLTGSGAISFRNGNLKSVGPDGVGNARTASTPGVLVGAFSDNNGRLISNWQPIGTFATIAAPAGAHRLLLRINGVTGREVGAYRVVADVVSSTLAANLGSASKPGGGFSIAGRTSTQSRYGLAQPQTVAMAGSSSRVTLGSRSFGPNNPGVIAGPTTATSRSDVQYVLRRLGFSDTPANVTAIYNSGISNWVTQQLAFAPDPATDTSINGVVEPLPTGLPILSNGNPIDFSSNVEHRLFQWQVATTWQLREKITLHWLEHFAINYSKVQNSSGAMGDMEHYIQTVRYDALGNYAKLLSDVAKEPAMLIWLDNANNNGASPSNPPNENFGREIMQLYSIGLFQLNPDGSQVPDPNNPGASLATYGEPDVKAMALALSGFQLQQTTPAGNYPSGWVDSVTFNAAAHAPSKNNSFTVMGQQFPDGKNCTWSVTSYKNASLNSGCVMDNAAQFLANQPTTWAFESKELIQRLVEENPSPAFVSRITAVWGANVNDPHQIAKVVQAIASDPEFMKGKYTMVKEPLEMEIDAIRALNGVATNLTTTAATNNGLPDPMQQAVNDTGGMNQETWYPPTVFSFYYPGDKEGLMNNAELLGRWNAAANLANSVNVTKACTANCNINLDFTSFAKVKSTQNVAGYLLDALVDGGTPELNALVTNYLNNNPNNISGALMIILTSPEYEVN